MAGLLKEDLCRAGYAFAKTYQPELDAVGVASALGKPMTPWEGGLVQDLVPRSTSTPNTYSGIYGLDQFPFHTDLAHWRVPPRYLLLRCVEGQADVETLLLDARVLAEAVPVDILRRAVFKTRRPQKGSITLLRLYQPTATGCCFRWDDVFIRPASPMGEVAAQRVRAELAGSRPISFALTRPGDTLLIDNWRMLHARSQVTQSNVHRRIHRIYLEALH